MPTLIEQLTAQHLGGPLPLDFIEIMRPLDDASEEGKQWMRRAFRAMEAAGFRTKDFSGYLASVLVSVPAMLPRAWDGSPPPITNSGRHTQIDEYIADNPWRAASAGSVFLDVGCGFPPRTTLDTGRRFPEFRVIGMDPAFGRYLVYDTIGDYAAFGHDGGLRFCWLAGVTPTRIAALLGNLPATRTRFRSLLDRLISQLPSGDSPAEAIATDGCRIVRDPLALYSLPNTRFIEAGIGLSDPPRADVVRIMNMLQYFDRPFKHGARRWVGAALRPGGLFLHGVNHPLGRADRYFLWRREENQLTPREYAISAGEMRSLVTTSWYTTYEDDEEMRQQTSLLAALWSDTIFRAEFDTALDAILANLDFAARRPDGFLGGLRPGVTPEETIEALTEIEARLDAGGWITRAAHVITRNTGKRAWRNSVGHLAVDPQEWGWKSVELA
jgi:hypothetical protein